MISKEGGPELAGIHGRRQAPEIARYGTLGYIQAKFQKFTVNSRSSPGGFSFAIRRMRARISASIFGLPRRLGRAEGPRTNESQLDARRQRYRVLLFAAIQTVGGARRGDDASAARQRGLAPGFRGNKFALTESFSSPRHFSV